MDVPFIDVMDVPFIDALWLDALLSFEEEQ
jgi:hypothetical protein